MLVLLVLTIVNFRRSERISDNLIDQIKEKNGYNKSYERSLEVNNLWVINNINLRKNNVEVLISGSSYNGRCRENRNNGSYRDNKDVEAYNIRFSIQIIPKVTNEILKDDI